MHFSIPHKATHTHFYIVILLIIFVSIFSNSFAFAQTSNIEKLYKKAIKEKQPQIRLNKLNEVIGLDPTHTEALIEMGNIYKSQKNYRLAEYYYILAKTALRRI